MKISKISKIKMKNCGVKKYFLTKYTVRLLNDIKKSSENIICAGE